MLFVGTDVTLEKNKTHVLIHMKNKLDEKVTLSLTPTEGSQLLTFLLEVYNLSLDPDLLEDEEEEVLN